MRQKSNKWRVINQGELTRRIDKVSDNREEPEYRKVEGRSESETQLFRRINACTEKMPKTNEERGEKVVREFKEQERAQKAHIRMMEEKVKNHTLWQ